MVVHSRGVSNLMGMIRWPSSLSFSVVMQTLKKIVSDFGQIPAPMYILKTFIGFLCVYPGQRAIHSNLRHLLWSLQSIGRISIYKEVGQTFSHYQC